MDNQVSITTDRLLIQPITVHDCDFIRELVNTAGWLEFIGDRNINSTADATGYIQKIIDNPHTVYWVVNLKDAQSAIGIITFIKRDYLDYHDIGFAFLPAYTGRGYAYEAAAAVLHNILRRYKDPYILATTNSNNVNSIRLLKRLGMYYEKEIEAAGEKMQVYAASTGKLCITETTRLFFNIFTNKEGKQPDFDLLREICIPEVLLISMADSERQVLNLASFTEPRKKILSNGELTDFEEREIYEETTISNNMAQRYSRYEKSGILHGQQFKTQGHKLLQFIKKNHAWKISSVIWEDSKN